MNVTLTKIGITGKTNQVEKLLNEKEKISFLETIEIMKKVVNDKTDEITIKVEPLNFETFELLNENVRSPTKSILIYVNNIIYRGPKDQTPKPDTISNLNEVDLNKKQVFANLNGETKRALLMTLNTYHFLFLQIQI